MLDLIKESAQSGQMVLWEEVARDGAQAKTLLKGPQRAEVARMTADIFKGQAYKHLIYAVGFPEVAKEEREAIREVVDKVDVCYLATHGKATTSSIDAGIKSLEGAKYGRVSFFTTVSETMSAVLFKKNRAAVKLDAINIAKYALDKSPFPIDVALADASASDPAFVAELAHELTELGVSIVKACDSVGRYYPGEADAFFEELFRISRPEILYGAHLHNDLGFALINNLNAAKRGARVLSSSWLGLGERNGLSPTENLLFALAHEPEKIEARLGIRGSLFSLPPDLKLLRPIAEYVSQHAQVPIKTTDAIIGRGINSISTGTPFSNPLMFQPFDPDKILGIPPTYVLTQLANSKIVKNFLDNAGIACSEEAMQKVLGFIKESAYRASSPVVAPETVLKFINDERLADFAKNV